MGKVISAIVAFVCLALLAVGAGDSQAERRKRACTKAKPCADCSTADYCSRSCKGTGCTFTHTGAGGADFHCPSGKCILNHPGVAGSTLHCKGGGCTLNHTGAGSSTLKCPGGACKIIATGTGSTDIVDCPKKNCTIECGPDAGQCSIDGVEVPKQ